MLTFFDAAVAAGAANGVPAGTFIPVSDLSGVVAGEFASAASQATKEGKGLFGLFNKFHAYISTNTNLLGVTATRAKASVSDVSDNYSFSFSCQYVGKLADQSFDVIPLAGSGANAGVGKLAIADVFPNAALVTAEGAISGEGMVIPHADLSAFGAVAPGSIDAGEDNRDYIFSMIRALPDLAILRAAGVASAVTTATQNAFATFTLAAAATAATDPTTGILATELDKIATVAATTTLTIQTIDNLDAQTFDVNVVAA